MFKSKKEFAKAMIDGGIYTLPNRPEVKLYYDEDSYLPFIYEEVDTGCKERLDGCWADFETGRVE